MVITSLIRLPSPLPLLLPLRPHDFVVPLRNFLSVFMETHWLVQLAEMRGSWRPCLSSLVSDSPSIGPLDTRQVRRAVTIWHTAGRSTGLHAQ